ncbi:MAG: hypothetical protein R2785_03245 [Flavobacteriaceae bacterium]
MIDIVILTDQKNINQFDKNGKVLNGYLEDAILKAGLEAEGLSVQRLSWDNPDFDWSTTKAILFRSTWDYFYRFNEFSIWLSNVSKQTKLINSLETINWNIDKHYLLDLKAKGIHIAESYFIKKGSTTTLHELYNTFGFNETVLKPCVSGTARHTYRLKPENLQEHEAVFKQLIRHEAMMLQPFQYDIVNKGEASMVLFNGKFSHAVLKTAKPNEFRVQTDFGGQVTIYQPSPEEIAFAEQTICCCSELPTYARVDIFNDNQGKIALAELELIEPELWFRLFPKAANTLAQILKIY